MNNGYNMEHVRDFDPRSGQQTDGHDVHMIPADQNAFFSDPLQSANTHNNDIPEHSRPMGSIQEETEQQNDANQRAYQSAILARLARRQSTMSRLGSRILPNSVIRGLLNSEEETPAEGHAHRHGIVSRAIPRSEVDQSSPRFSPFASLSSRGGRRRSSRGPYFIPRADTAMSSQNGHSVSSSGVSGEGSTESGWGWRRSVRLRRVGHSLSTPIAQMFGQPSSEMTSEEGMRHPYHYDNPDSVGYIPHPGPMDTRMDFDTPHEPDSVEPPIGDPQPDSGSSSQSQPNTRHFPSLMRPRPSRALRREDHSPLSRVLQLAATAIASQLSGGDGPALPNIQSGGNDGLDGSLEGFIQSLQRATTGQQAPGDSANNSEEDRSPTPVNFMRVFRFANADGSRSPEASDQRRSDVNQAPSHGDNMDSDHPPDGPDGRTVTLVVIGVRSVPSGNGPAGEHPPAALPGLDALLRLPFLSPGTLSPRAGSRPAAMPFSRPAPPSMSATNEDSQSNAGLTNPLRRQSDAGSRGTPSSLPSIISESPPGPNPPPSTPAEPGLSTVSSGASTPHRRSSTTSAFSPNVPSHLNENRTMNPRVDASDEGVPLNTAHQRRRSDSEFARHREQLGSGSPRRNGVVEPDNHGPSPGRSWLIYVVGTNLSENHPAFAAPSLFTDVGARYRFADFLLIIPRIRPTRTWSCSRHSLARSNLQ